MDSFDAEEQKKLKRAKDIFDKVIMIVNCIHSNHPKLTHTNGSVECLGCHKILKGGETKMEKEMSMRIRLAGLNPEEEFVVKWQYGMLGHFGTSLIETICLADDRNLEGLSLGFPIEVAGYLKYARQPGWWKKVQDKALVEEKEE